MSKKQSISADFDSSEISNSDSNSYKTDPTETYDTKLQSKSLDQEDEEDMTREESFKGQQIDHIADSRPTPVDQTSNQQSSSSDP